MTLYLTSPQGPQLVGLGEIGLFDIEYCQCSPQHSSPFVTDTESRTNQLPINRFTDDAVFTSLLKLTVVFCIKRNGGLWRTACKPIRRRQEKKLSYRGTVTVIWGSRYPYRKPLQSNHWSKIFETCAGISCAIYS